MAGLLYKDFKAIKGHYYIIAFIVITIVLIFSEIFGVNEEIDVLVGICLSIIPLVLLGMLVAKVEVGIIAADETKNAKLYLLSLPVSSKDYIASKYWFMLIGHYIVLSVAMLWSITYQIQVVDEWMNELVVNIISLLPPIICGSICLVAIELPFFVLAGSKKGEMIKTAILLMMMLGIFVFLLFGDLTILDAIDLKKFFEYIEEHIDVLFKIQIFAPVISLILYYCSYVITCNIFERREIGYES